MLNIFIINHLRQTNDTESEVEVANVRNAAVTVGNATVGSTEVPATAPTHAGGPRRGTYGIVGIVAYIRVSIPVFAPLPYIT